MPPIPSWLGPAARVDQALNLLLESSRLPVVAAINGLAMGGGLELALACDIRLAAVSARFGLPEVIVGAFASGGGTQRLPRLVGPGRAMELLLTGRTIDAEEALRLGVVERRAGRSLLPRAITLGQPIASMPVPGSRRRRRVSRRASATAGPRVTSSRTSSP